MRVCACLVLAVLSGGCALGPRALELTHGRYQDAVSVVEEEQLLRNVVRVRYDEAPLVLNITSVTTQFEFSGSTEARPFFSTEATGNLFRSFTSILPFAQAGASARPTFTFDPADDGTTMRQFLTPITDDALSVLFRTVPQIDTVLLLWVERINGLADIRRVVQILQAIKDRGLVSIQPDDREEVAGGPIPASAMTAVAAVEAARNGLRYRPSPDSKSWLLVRRVNGLAVQLTPGAESSPEIAELRSLLGLRPDLTRYRLRVIEAALPEPAAHANGDTIHLTARSTARVYKYLANSIEVPEAHITEGVARSPYHELGGTEGVFTVHSCAGHKRPPHAFVAVHYRGHWYYVDDRDTSSKASLALVLQLGRLDFKRQKIGSGPALTLPVGR